MGAEQRAELEVRGPVACVVTLRGREATAEVIDYSGTGPTKHDVEDALYAARRWVLAEARGVAPDARFAPAWAQGEVAVFTLALGPEKAPRGRNLAAARSSTPARPRSVGAEANAR